MIRFLLGIILLMHCHCSKTCRKLDLFCNCDEQCSVYGDCCQGHPNFNKTGTLSHTVSCKTVSGFGKIWVVDKCADSTHKLSGLCAKTETPPNKRLYSMIPVVSKDAVFYENQFCALCNSQTKFEYLKIKVSCLNHNPKTFMKVRDLVNNGSCDVIVLYPENLFRYCIKNIIRTCPADYIKNNNKTIFNLCENKVSNYVTLVSDGRNIYRNDHCCDCWNSSCYPIQSSDSPLSPGFSYLLNFNEWVDDLTGKENNTTSSTMDNRTTSTVAEETIYFMSFMFTVMSMMALTLLIVIYASQRIFHTFGGYLTICLSVCLFSMNLMTLLVTNKAVTSSSFCRCLGVIQHFISLSTFIWMAIYALDLMQTFGFGGSSRSKKKSLKSFFIYCGIGFGLATIIVGTSTIIDVSLGENSTIRPKYGGPKCWFTSQVGGILWYFAPVCILLAWNILACIVVFYKLSKTARECRVVQEKDSNNTLWLCIRLTAVFGIGYVFQVVAILSGINVLVVFGSLINCLQGCLLTACFVWTKRVLNVVTTTIGSITGSVAATDTSQSQGTRVTAISKNTENVEINKK